MFFCILVHVHDYTLSFIGSACCNVSSYNYISILPYYIVIHLAWLERGYLQLSLFLKHPSIPMRNVG